MKRSLDIRSLPGRAGPVPASDDTQPFDLDTLYPDLLDNEGVPNYRRGRKYSRLIAAAHHALETGDPTRCARLMKTADLLLWPLDDAHADALRDFLAGIAREDEIRIGLIGVLSLAPSGRGRRG